VSSFALSLSNSCCLSVTTPDFAREEDQSIAKLTAVNAQLQASIDEQRMVLHALEQEISNLTQKL
jgi:hypothetical protein